MKVEALTAKQILALVESRDFKCAVTGLALDPPFAKVDHIMPVKRGGDHALDNAQVVHAEINRMKGMLTPDEFLGLCALVVRGAGESNIKSAIETAEAAFGAKSEAQDE